MENIFRELSIHNILSLLDNICTLQNILIAISTFCVVKISEKIKRKRICKCLSLDKKNCKVVIPNYNLEIHTSGKLPMCPVGDIIAAVNVVDLIHKSGLYSHQEAIIYEPTQYSSTSYYNLFCVGGSLANHYSRALFKDFFPTFKIFASKHKIETNPNNLSPEFFVQSETKRGFSWGLSPTCEFLVKPDERFAILVKLTEKDFNIRGHGTVFILFGNGIEGTLAISKYLLYNYEDLYRRTKKNKHFFIVFKVHCKTGEIIPNTILDLTEEMFYKYKGETE